MGWGDHAGKQGAWNFTGPQTKYEIAVSIARLLKKKTKQNKTKYINKYQYNKIFRLVEAKCPILEKLKFCLYSALANICSAICSF